MYFLIENSEPVNGRYKYKEQSYKMYWYKTQNVIIIVNTVKFHQTIV